MLVIKKEKKWRGVAVAVAKGTVVVRRRNLNTTLHHLVLGIALCCWEDV